jgi:hypothetical protein
MKSKLAWRWGRLVVLVGMGLLAVACGGGGGGGDSGEVVTITDPSGTTPGNTPPGGTTPPGTSSLLDPTIVSRPGEGGNYPPMVAIDNAGNALAVWRLQRKSVLSPEGLSEELLARRYVAGSGWQAIESIAGPTTKQSLESAVISMDKTTGKAMVVWHLVGGTVLEAGSNIFPSSIVSRAFDPAAGWAAPLAVDSNKIIRIPGIALATDADGNVMAMWNRYEGQKTNLYASRNAASGGWSTPVSIEPRKFIRS